MADRYLLESGSPDGYLLEDGSGVLLLDTPATVGWHATDASGDFNISQYLTVTAPANLVVTGTTGVGSTEGVRASSPAPSGKFQYEVTLTTLPGGGSDNVCVGIDGASVSLTALGLPSDSYTYVSGGGVFERGAFAQAASTAVAGQIVTVAGDTVNGTLKLLLNGVQQGTTVTGISLASWWAYAGTPQADVFTANFTGPFTYQQTGYSAYDPGTGTVSHATTGVLTGPGSTIAGTAAHVALHGTSGALTGPGSTIAGTAAHIAIHGTTGALIGPGSTIVGSAARTAVHTTTGVLTGPGSTIAGVAVYNAKHTTTGALIGPGSVVIGAAARTREHATSGVLTGPGSTIAGTAVYNAKHTTSGALIGPGSTVAGIAARFRAFATSGTLVGPGSTIVGAALRGTISTTHATSGALVGQPSIIDGTAARTRHHATSGVLVGPPALIVGVNARWRDHGSSGAILGVTGVVFGRAFNGTPQLHDIPVDSDNLTDEPASPSANLGSITEPSGQIVNHPPYPPAELA